MEKLKGYGNVEGIAKLIESDCSAGLLPDVDARRTEIFGTNVLPISPPVSIFEIMWDTLHDPILILLLVAAAVSELIAWGSGGALIWFFQLSNDLALNWSDPSGSFVSVSGRGLVIRSEPSFQLLGITL